DRLLAGLADAQDRLERELSGLLPELPRQKELARLTPGDLLAALPPRTAVVDLLRYNLLNLEPKRPGRERATWTPSYVAFVLAAGRPVRRVELGPCGPIDQAVTAWRKAIAARQDSPAAGELRRRLWRPLAEALPGGTQSLYLCPDGELARLPFAA